MTIFRHSHHFGSLCWQSFKTAITWPVFDDNLSRQPSLRLSLTNLKTQASRGQSSMTICHGSHRFGHLWWQSFKRAITSAFLITVLAITSTMFWWQCLRQCCKTLAGVKRCLLYTFSCLNLRAVKWRSLSVLLCVVVHMSVNIRESFIFVHVVVAAVIGAHRWRQGRGQGPGGVEWVGYILIFVRYTSGHTSRHVL